MRVVSILILLITLASCSSNWHLKRAKFKQPDILSQYNDTINVTDIRLDTIRYKDTFKVVQTITKRDTVIKVKEIKPEVRWKTRIEYKELKQKEKTKRKVAKENRKESKSKAKYDYKSNKQREITERRGNSSGKWMWYMLLIGLGIGVIGTFLVRFLIKRFI